VRKYVRHVCSYSPWFAPWVSAPRRGGWSPRWQSSRPPSARSGSAGLTKSEQLTSMKKKKEETLYSIIIKPWVNFGTANEL
jgi:hypothetical protein